MLNKILLIGRLTQYPEIRYTPGGSAIARFTIAVRRPNWNKTDKNNEVDFIPIVAWGNMAENMKYTQKGELVFVEGRLNIRKYQTATGGNKTATEVKAMRIIFMERTTKVKQEDMQKSSININTSNSKEDTSENKKRTYDISFAASNGKNTYAEQERFIDIDIEGDVEEELNFDDVEDGVDIDLEGLEEIIGDIKKEDDEEIIF
ncbi:MAG: single-stranded DNA-binding protein [Thermovenabulum sp.]|uniref:single-stranded DNA-binding protein n=1 Tax=Thermovenabulum sp. TaxID=3100335 RepID=UPI003C7E54DE